MHNPEAIIVGSGVAGMASAIRLATQGYSVKVFEKNDYPGGKLSFIEKDGYRFDAGPSLFTKPHYLEELFHDAGESLEDYFSYSSVPLSCRYFFENDTIVNAWTDVDLYEEELFQKLGEPKGALKAYLDKSAALYEGVGNIFLNHSLHQISTWLQTRVLKVMKQVNLNHLFGSLHRYNQKKFISEEAVQIFNRYATYNGSNPYQTPAMMSMIPHLELNEGTYYPAGGMISITNALYRLAEKKGVRFFFNHSVESIVKETNRVSGIISKGVKYDADIVVSNADVYFTYQQLLNMPSKAKNILKQERSCSGVIFYWGIRESFPDLHLHNIFFSDSYKDEFHHVFKKKVLFSDPTVYVNITSKMDKAHAPEGKENWFVLINAPSNNEYDWDEGIRQLRDAVIRKLSRILNKDIGALIETEMLLDPNSIEIKTGSYMGSLYGTSSNSPFAAFLRHPNFSRQFSNLYFCGGSVHPGGGIPLCFKSAEIVAKKVAQDFNNKN
ncbi:MAG: 1-hydroxycarotenoid 3,4-desaturase CrtD [Bacteroidota bacterium]